MLGIEARVLYMLGRTIPLSYTSSSSVVPFNKIPFQAGRMRIFRDRALHVEEKESAKVCPFIFHESKSCIDGVK